ncbi:MAG: hypothetical protein ABIC91_09120 [Nanoarchaeota archaeon]|nr:hypothetical protein [Nanoarchaeota archaeon]MBU1029994.1 hypothetical protein [Nanoarchaeota archaeon]MBU1849367.1 hypothetical protein [Nanoarchaeota archaeon]
MKKRYSMKKVSAIIFFLILVLIILLLPSLFRYMQEKPVFFDSVYYDLRVAEAIRENGFVVFDDLQERRFDINLFHYVLSLFSNNNLVIQIFGLFLGIITIIFYWQLLTFFEVDFDSSFFSILIFILSPIFIYLFAVLRSSSFSIPLMLISLILFFKGRRVLSSLPLLFISLFNIPHFIITVFLMLVFSHVKKNYSKILIPIIISSVSLIIAVFAFSYNPIIIFLKNSFENVFTSFGAMIGIPVFVLFLSVIGLIFLWNKKREFLFLSLTFVLFLLLSFFSKSIMIVFNFFMCFFAGFAFNFFMKRKWAVVLVRKFTILLIFCSIIFSTLVYIDVLSESQPSKGLFNAFIFLKEQNFNEDLVFTHESYGFFVEYFSSKETFIDEKSRFLNDYAVLDNFTQQIFYSKDLDKTNLLLLEKNIRFILITPEMKEGLVWKKPDAGLLFLLENSDSFSKIYNLDGVEIWVHPKQI